MPAGSGPGILPPVHGQDVINARFTGPAPAAPDPLAPGTSYAPPAGVPGAVRPHSRAGRRRANSGVRAA